MTTCPTCGSIVRIYPGGVVSPELDPDTTKNFISIIPDLAQALADVETAQDLEWARARARDALAIVAQNSTSVSEESQNRSSASATISSATEAGEEGGPTPARELARPSSSSSDEWFTYVCSKCRRTQEGRAGHEGELCQFCESGELVLGEQERASAP